MNWHVLVEKIRPYIFMIQTPEGSGTGFLFTYNDRKTVFGVATAAHVIEHANEWKLPIKLKHYNSQTEIFVNAEERAVFIDKARDSASILIAGNLDYLPKETLPLIDPDKFKKIGVEVGWMGFPSIAYPELCFFTGGISAFAEDSYLIDGVAINGVSGGPVFCELKSGEPQIIGTVLAYMANRIRGDALPGLLKAQDVTSFHKHIKLIKDIDEARQKQEEERRRQEEELKNMPPNQITE